jgi:hypothetical protein
VVVNTEVDQAVDEVLQLMEKLKSVEKGPSC